MILNKSEPGSSGPAAGPSPGLERSAPLVSAPPGCGLLLLLGECPPGELLQRPVAGHVATERDPALGTDGQLRPVSTVATHNVTLGTLPDLSRT